VSHAVQIYSLLTLLTYLLTEERLEVSRRVCVRRRGGGRQWKLHLSSVRPSIYPSSKCHSHGHRTRYGCLLLV